MGRKKGLLSSFGVTFSWKRAIGLTALRQRVARVTGVPTTTEGRRRKYGPYGSFLLQRYLFSAGTGERPAASEADQLTASIPSEEKEAGMPPQQPVAVAQNEETNEVDVALGCAIITLVYVIGVLSGCIISAIVVGYLRSAR